MSEPPEIDEPAFHAGERALQESAGLVRKLEERGKKLIRRYMPDQHRAFFEMLPFIVIGSVDGRDWPWASIVSGQPGFLQSPDDKTLRINGRPVSSDPLEQALIKTGAPLGLLGIELETRRRNRMNGRVIVTDNEGFSVSVDQSFGNCPQYIQTRTLEFIDGPGARRDEIVASPFAALDGEAKHLIQNAESFYVASYVKEAETFRQTGVDVSHRGGRPGFVKLDGDTLTIPDFSGNLFFNTLGNFLVNPKAGLLFPDFSTGDLLMMTGRVELLLKAEAEVLAFKGAQRAWRFLLNHGQWLKGSLPFRAPLDTYSPKTLNTGKWP